MTFGRNMNFLLKATSENERALDVRILAVGAHINQREARSLTFRLDGYNVLIIFLAHFEFDVVAVLAFASQFVRIVLGRAIPC